MSTTGVRIFTSLQKRISGRAKSRRTKLLIFCAQAVLLANATSAQIQVAPPTQADDADQGVAIVGKTRSISPETLECGTSELVERTAKGTLNIEAAELNSISVRARGAIAAGDSTSSLTRPTPEEAEAKDLCKTQVRSFLRSKRQAVSDEIGELEEYCEENDPPSCTAGHCPIPPATGNACPNLAAVDEARQPEYVRCYGPRPMLLRDLDSKIRVVRTHKETRDGVRYQVFSCAFTGLQSEINVSGKAPYRCTPACGGIN